MTPERIFRHQVRAFPVSTGTAANSLSLATLSPPYGVIFAHEEAHIANDECGAPGFFSGGAQIAFLRARTASSRPRRWPLRSRRTRWPSTRVQPAALSLTQATELGTAYRPDEVAAPRASSPTSMASRCRWTARASPMRWRSSSAIPGDVTWRAGVDVLSFGATKNGALAAEAVVFFDRDAGARLRAAAQAGRPSRSPSHATSRRSCWLTWRAESGCATPAHQRAGAADRPRRRRAHCCIPSRRTRSSSASAAAARGAA